MTGHEWTVSIATNSVQSVHYCDEVEAKRLAERALADGLRVNDGPRPMSSEEAACGKYRVGCYRVAA